MYTRTSSTLLQSIHQSLLRVLGTASVGTTIHVAGIDDVPNDDVYINHHEYQTTSDGLPDTCQKNCVSDIQLLLYRQTL